MQNWEYLSISGRFNLKNVFFFCDLDPMENIFKRTEISVKFQYFSQKRHLQFA